MALQKLNQWKRFRRPPCLVGQAENAKQREGEDGYLGKKSYFHAEPCGDCRLDKLTRAISKRFALIDSNSESESKRNAAKLPVYFLR